MPYLQWGDYLVAYLFEVGPTMASGMGEGPLTFSEIECWARVCGIELQPWEARLLRRLSGEYLTEAHHATKRDRAPPFGASPALQQSIARSAARNLADFLR